MTSAPLILCAALSKEEHPIALAAAQQFSAAVNTALGSVWPIKLVLANADGRIASASIWIASMIDDVSRREPIEATTQRWQERRQRWSQRGGKRILLATLFGSVPCVSGDPTKVERLRRLNMMALRLSRESGIEIVDIDRLFSLCGARKLATDYRCRGESAAQLAGHAITAAIFAGGLDDFLPAEVQERAATLHGGIQDVAGILQRRTTLS